MPGLGASLPAAGKEPEDIFSGIDQGRRIVKPVAPVAAPVKGSSLIGMLVKVLVGALIIGAVGLAFWYFAIYRSTGSQPAAPALPPTELLPPTSTTETPVSPEENQVPVYPSEEPTTSQANEPLQVLEPPAVTTTFIPLTAPVTTTPPNTNVPPPTPVLPLPLVVPTTTTLNAVTSTPAQTVDSDGDGLSDAREVELGTDPNKADTDGDGLSDGDEVLKYGTNPLNPDTDGDTYPDGTEVNKGYNPRGEGKCANPGCVL